MVAPDSPQDPEPASLGSVRARVTRVSAIVSGVAGAAVLAGWGLDVRALTGAIGAHPPVSPDTAIGVLLLAVALGASRGHAAANKATAIWAAAAVGQALLVLAHYRGYIPSTPGDWIVPAAALTPGLHLGRMAPATFGDVLALGLAALCGGIGAGRLWCPAVWLAALPLALSTVGLTSYLYQVHQVLGVTPFAPQTPLAVLAFAVLSVGSVMRWAPDGAIRVFTRRDPIGILARRMVPAAVLVPVAMGWLRLEGQRRGAYGTETGLVLMVMGTALLLIVFTWITARRLEAIEEQRRLVTAQERQARERLSHAVHAGHVALWDWNLVEGAVWLSPEWKRQIGYDDDEIGNRFSEWECRLHPDDRQRALDTVNAYLAGADAEGECEFRFRHKDGSYRHILMRATEVRDEQGRRVRLVGSHVDITDYVALQAQVQQGQRLESLGQLAGGVAHDFNNLLTVINGSADLLLEQLPKGNHARGDAQAIRDAGRRAGDLTRQLLAFSRQQPVALVVLNLGEAVRGMEGLLRRLVRENVALELRVSPTSGNVRADPGQVEQIVVNLAVNAQDAMPRGGALRIEVSDVELDHHRAPALMACAPGPYVRLSVSDTGEGMSEATRARIFEPFFTTKSAGKGTGLGLATVYGIVRRHDGAIDVESQPARGTTFQILLPRVSEPVARPTAPEVLPAGAPATVLVVEDEPGLRKILVRMLEAAGHAVLVAETGDEAVARLREHPGPIDLMLTDVVMPGMTSLDLLAHATELRAAMAVVFMSGYATSATGESLVPEGARFLAKPFTQAALTQEMREALAGRLGC